MISRFLAFLCLCFFAMEAKICAQPIEKAPQEYSKKTPSFVVKSSVSSGSISLNQNVILHLILEYPSNYIPDIDLMRRRLLTGGGIDDSPFILLKDTVQLPKEGDDTITQEIDFILSPLRSGKHFLTARLIRFNAKDANDKFAEIPSEVFKIAVSNPEVAVNLPSLIEPPMEQSLELPVTLSQANRMNFLENPSQLDAEAQEDADFVNSRTIPWLTVLAAIISLLVMTYVRLLPRRSIKIKIDQVTKEKVESEIRSELQAMASKRPKDGIETKANIIHLSFLLRLYLLKKYEFPAFSFTAEELAHETNLIEEIPLEVKKGMNQVFYLASQIKFAKYTPTPQDYRELLESIQAL